MQVFDFICSLRLFLFLQMMADSFLDGDVSLDCFIDDYHRKRCLAHHRRVKIDKLREIVLKGLNQPDQTNFISANLPSPPNRLQDLTSSPSLHTNGSPSPLTTRASPTPPFQAQPSALPYPASPYPFVPSIAASGYPPNSYMAQPYPSAVSQHPSPSNRLPPRSGFIMQ